MLIQAAHGMLCHDTIRVLPMSHVTVCMTSTRVWLWSCPVLKIHDMRVSRMPSHIDIKTPVAIEVAALIASLLYREAYSTKAQWMWSGK